MKCEECLPLLEEYVDRELEGRTAERLAAHLAACLTCLDALNELSCEAELYASYQPDINVTPALWNAVQARIKEEKITAITAIFVAPPTRLQKWFAQQLEGFAEFGAQRFFQPTSAALVLTTIVIVAGVTSLLRSWPERQPEPSSTSQTALQPADNSGSTNILSQPNPHRLNNVALPTEVSKHPAIASGGDGTIGTLSHGTLNKRRIRNATTKDAVTTTTTTTAAAAKLRRASEEEALFEREVAELDGASTNLFMPKSLDGVETEIARHVEKSQLLLRSFRNAQLSALTYSSDIAYDKEQSRKLLYRNIILRRDAATQGSRQVEQLLNTLEPILLDIANLPDRPTSRDVLSIEQQMQKTEIVAELQVHSASATSSFN